MASTAAAQFRDAKPTLPVSPASSGTMSQPLDGQPGSPHDSKFNDKIHRRSRSDDEESNGSGGELDTAVDGSTNTSSNLDGPGPRKRRRSRKGLDKRFECPEEGCGKSYSRAEHL